MYSALKILLIKTGFLLFTFTVCAQGNNGKHLFILSGQSNMELLRPNESFLPILTSKYGAKDIIVKKYALGSQPIRRWYKDWKPLQGDEPKAQADLYDSLMVKVIPAIKNKTITSVTFIWMQGERDAREGHGDVYEQSLMGLYQQLSKDLDRNDINFVIGRLSDCGLTKKGWPHWEMIRTIQVKVADSNPRFAWVNTDDLNDGINRKGMPIKDDIHMSAQGYITLGERFAEKAIELIETHN